MYKELKKKRGERAPLFSFVVFLDSSLAHILKSYLSVPCCSYCIFRNGIVGCVDGDSVDAVIDGNVNVPVCKGGDEVTLLGIVHKPEPGAVFYVAGDETKQSSVFPVIAVEYGISSCRYAGFNIA